MAQNRLPGPLAGATLPSLDNLGTLSRSASFAPGPITVGRRGAALTPGLFTASKQVDVDAYLAALGMSAAVDKVRERVEVAATFFERFFSNKSQSQVVDYLKGIDFSKEVRVVALAATAPVGSLLQQHLVGNRPGNFFTKSGFGIHQLGIARGNRALTRFRVVAGGTPVLVSRTTGVSDTWTPGRTLNVYSPTPGRGAHRPPGRAGELVGGGGVQIVIPDPVTNSVQRV